jgi:nitric oxide reductase NorE protein
MTAPAHAIAPEAGRAGQRSRKIPAEPAFWAFVLADMSVFAGFFGFYLWALDNNRADFAAAAAHLIVPVGFVNTLVLVGSSWTAVRALSAHRAGRYVATRIYLRITVAGAAVFVIVKASEYAAEIANGHTMVSAPFFMYYYVLTALHLMHVTIGTLLIARWYRSLQPGARPASRIYAECAAGYWHMVDLLWLIIFSFLYIGSHL